MKRPDLVLAFCRRYIAENGYAPSLREIQRGCGLSSTSVASYQLRKLRARGAITQPATRTARAIHVVDGNP